MLLLLLDCSQSAINYFSFRRDPLELLLRMEVGLLAVMLLKDPRLDTGLDLTL